MLNKLLINLCAVISYVCNERALSIVELWQAVNERKSGKGPFLDPTRG